FSTFFIECFLFGRVVCTGVVTVVPNLKWQQSLPPSARFFLDSQLIDALAAIRVPLASLLVISLPVFFLCCHAQRSARRKEAGLKASEAVISAAALALLPLQWPPQSLQPILNEKSEELEVGVTCVAVHDKTFKQRDGHASTRMKINK
ncbi:unnamed protein product, partial [Trypanosoma congolense IL3000]